MNKSALKSKTLWVSIIVAIAPLFPSVRAILVANPESAGLIVAGVFSVLRVLTGKPLVLEK